jgi:hypothetical protein
MTSPPWWAWRDPGEAELAAAVSTARLMADVQTMGAWERESGTPGEALAFDHIERELKDTGFEVDRRQVEAFISLPEVGRVILPDGSAIEGLAPAFSTSTVGTDGSGGLVAELVDAGQGSREEHARARSAGKIALVASLATPGLAWAAQEAGAAGQIFGPLDTLHNSIVTTVWGTPTPETAARIPRTPCVSIRRPDAERLRALLVKGPVKVRLVTRLRTGWMPIPHLTADLPGHAEDRFVLFSGHVDAWHHGAMDNGSANATMLEVARLLAARRDRRRGLRLAFWSGHSHGRYAGSAWYADHFWLELHRRCVLHLYVDSVGARGATDYSTLHGTEEAQGFAEALVRDVTGQETRAGRFSRAGDQSFWGIGVPSALMSLSGIPKQDTELSRTMQRLFGTAGYPWWWHTRDDTVDKIDPDVLTLDTRVYAVGTLRLLNAPVLPLDPARAVRTLLRALEDLAGVAGPGVDLAPAVDAARSLAERAEALRPALDRLARDPHAPGREGANRLLLRLSRALVPLGYTSGDRYHHDLAVPLPALAGLQRARELRDLDPGSDRARFTQAAIVRERNRVVHALSEADLLIDDWLTRKEI